IPRADSLCLTIEVKRLSLSVPTVATWLASWCHASRGISGDADAELRRSRTGLRCGSEIADHRSHNVRRGSLGGRVTICLNADRDYANNGDQTNAGDTKSERYLDKREGRREFLFHLR